MMFMEYATLLTPYKQCLNGIHSFVPVKIYELYDFALKQSLYGEKGYIVIVSDTCDQLLVCVS